MGSYQHSHGSRKVKSLEEALKGERHDFKGKLSSSKMYGGKASFWPRIIVYGITCSILLFGLGFVGLNVQTNYLRNQAEIRYRIINNIYTKQKELTNEQLDDFYDDMGVIPGTHPTNEQYSDYLENTINKISE